MNWEEKLQDIAQQGRYLQDLDIMDVAFKSQHSLELYVASRAHQRQRGLAGLSALDTDGMLFYYSVPTYSPFTMQETKIDLDIAWFDKSGKMLDIQSHEAYEIEPVVTSNKFSYVIEAKQGMIPFSDLQVTDG